MNLKQLRLQAKKTQPEISQELGIPLRSYQEYESCRSQMKYSTLIKLADYFGCSVDYLIGHQSSDIIYNDFTQDQQKAISMIKKLNEKEVAMLLGYLARMTNTPLETLSEDKQEQKANF